jgi:hypothetical protein
VPEKDILMSHRFYGGNMNEIENLHALFVKDLENTILIYKKLVGGFAPNTEKILYNPDKIDSLSNLMRSGDVQKGFKVLRNNSQLDKTFESLVIRYNQLFDENIVIAAQWRLDNAWKMDKRI